MKKIICLLLSLVLTVSFLSSCNDTHNKTIDSELVSESSDNTQSAKTEKWDGSIASKFEGGNGSEASPYLIATASQLAYLSQSTNTGTDYSKKYFSLINDIDLNNIEWTPIGNGEYSFEGYFDGAKHSIKNLKLTTALTYSYTYPHTTSIWGLAGLFGICQDATICNLNITSATVSIDNVKNYDQLYVGVLVGRFSTTTDCKISNIKISDSTISTFISDTSVENLGMDAIYLGGLIGYTLISEYAKCTIDAVQSELDISCEEGYRYANCVGAIIGNITNENIFSCTDFASYVTVKWPTFSGENYAGAFGYILQTKGLLTLSNGFSELKINTSLLPNYTFYSHEANAIIGNNIKVNNKDNPDNCKYIFKNLFGCVKPINNSVGFSAPICKLYSISDNTVFSEDNCKGCNSLPQNHGLDIKLWNCTDSLRPILN